MLDEARKGRGLPELEGVESVKRVVFNAAKNYSHDKNRNALVAQLQKATELADSLLDWRQRAQALLEVIYETRWFIDGGFGIEFENLYQQLVASIQKIKDTKVRTAVGKELFRNIVRAGLQDQVMLPKAWQDPKWLKGYSVSSNPSPLPRPNPSAESFMKTLKYEEVLLWDYQTYTDVLERVPYFIEEVYNKKRLHSSIGYMSPEEYEQVMMEKSTAVCKSLLKLGDQVTS